VVLMMEYNAFYDQSIASVLFGQRDRGLNHVWIETRREAYVVAVRSLVFHYFSLYLIRDVIIQNGLPLMLRDDFIKLVVDGLRIMSMAIRLVQILTKSFKP